MHRVVTGSRLHFGLVAVATGGHWGDRLGAPTLAARRFGGAGLMIDAPGCAVRVEDAGDWSAEGPSGARALDVARRVAARLNGGPLRVVVERAAPEHAGLGTGTQLALATARAVCLSRGSEASAEELARLAGRGERSAVGVHGFARGGFLVDGGRGERSGLAPLVAHAAFPSEWRVLSVVPAGAAGLAGQPERAAFAALRRTPEGTLDALCRLVLLGMLPALHEADEPAFGEALFDFNARSGDLFAAAQGGTYVGPAAAVVAWLRAEGVRGAGQSSWGPAVFGVVADEGRGRWLAGRVEAAFPGARVWLAAGA